MDRFCEAGSEVGLEMRIAFVKSLFEVMAEHDDAYLLTGDLGFMAFEPLSEKYGKRFVNVGLCEANMIGLASGLSRAGKLPFCYSMVPFITMRCLEQIRVHLSMGRQGIVLIGVGAGYGYGKQGSSHHAIEDIGIMNSLPGLRFIRRAITTKCANQLPMLRKKESQPIFVLVRLKILNV